MKSKIGRSLLLTLLICIIVSVATVNTIAMFMSADFSNSLMLMHTKTGAVTLKRELVQQQERLENIASIIGFSLDDISVDRLHSLMEFEGDFFGYYDVNGELAESSDNYALSDIDSSGSEYGGVVLDSNGGLTVQCLKKLYKDENYVGALVVGMYLSENAWLDEIKEEMETEVTIISGNTRIATTIIKDDGTRNINTNIDDKIYQMILAGNEYGGTTKIFGQKYFTNYQPMTDINGFVVGAFFAGVSSAESDRMKGNVIITTIIAAVVLVLCSSIAMGLYSVKRIIKPIATAEKMADSMFRGAMHEPMPEGTVLHHDEIGNFLGNLDASKNVIMDIIDDVNKVLASMANGDFTAKPAIEYKGDFKTINDSFERINSTLTEVLDSIDQSSERVSESSISIANGSQTVADGTAKQAAAIEKLSVSINEIAQKVNQSTKNAAEANSISTKSFEKIDFQNGEMANMLKAMDEIKDKSDEIKTVIKVIDDIAFQTNILALNAAIEASRAGDAGKGFAVVADEVRNLAGKSADSAKQTGELINAAIAAVNEGIKITNSTAGIMQEVTTLSNQITKYVNEISGASEEQSESINEVKLGIEEINSVVQENSASAEETAAACRELSEQSSLLNEQLAKLKIN